MRQLIGFTRVWLEPGETVEVSFHVHADLASYTDRALRRRVDPGLIGLVIGSDAAAGGEMATVELFGPIRQVDHTREMSVPVDVRVVSAVAQ